MASDPLLTFDRFRLDPSSGQLHGESGPISLTPKALSLLEYLASRPGRLIKKTELLDALWPDTFVADGALKVCIREIRRALGDDAQAPRFIETAHRRGYRFIAGVTQSAPAAAARPAPIAEPAAVLPGPVQYARSGDVNIAYQVCGSGPVDLVFVMGWVSHLEYFWKEPSFARFLSRLASFSRLILFDKRGTGLSDPVTHLPTLEQRMDDVRAVLDAVGSRHAVLLGVSEGGPMCSLFAATHPAQTDALIMIGTYARRLRAPDYPWAPTRAQREAFFKEIVDNWGGPVGLAERAPSMSNDPAFRDWWASFLRMGASPAAAIALTRMNAEIDVRHILPTIRVPTLVLHRTGDRCLLAEEGRYVASLIPNAALRRAAGRRSSAVCRRSGLAARRDRALSRRRPDPRRCRPRAGHHAVRRTGAAAGDAQRGHGAWIRAAPQPGRRSGVAFRAQYGSSLGRSRSWWSSTAPPAPSGVAARSAPKPGGPASACGSACIPVSAT